jgi:hypothetical protein
MRRKVLLAGAGQLGSRYLQGMAKHKQPLEISVCDPSAASLEGAALRWAEMGAACEVHDVHWITDLADLSGEFDLAVLATTADVRPELAQRIAAQGRIKNWVMEKVLAQSLQGLDSLQQAVGPYGSAWINTPMYMWSLYRQLREKFVGNSPVHASFEGFRGLACNAIHYIDFVSRWNGAVITEVDTSGLERSWHPAKREGFFEVDGLLELKFEDGSTLRMATGAGLPPYSVQISAAGQEWKVSESGGFALSADGMRIEGSTAFQSQLTSPLMEAIFDKGECALPTLAQSDQQHRVFLSALLKHWNSVMPARSDILFIT